MSKISSSTPSSTNSNSKYQPYEPVKTHDDSGDEIELQNQSNPSQSSTNSTITNLLKLTAHRRIRRNTSQSLDIDHDTVISIDDDDHNESTKLITKSKSNDIDLSVMDDIDLDNAHASSEGEGDGDDIDNYDDHVLLLFLDGTKKKAGIMNKWKVWQIKEKYFKSELNERKNVRLIYRGKMLQDMTDISSYNIPSGGFIHVSISKNGNLYRGATNSASGQFDGNGSGDVNYDNFDDGMDDEAVARRLQMQLNQEMPGRPWMNGVGGDQNDQDIINDPQRARREFLCGMFLGSVAGIWILIFLILANRNQYSRRFRLGVTLGVAINLIVQLSYQYDNVNDGSDPTNGTSGDDGNGANVSETDPSAGGEVTDDA